MFINLNKTIYIHYYWKMEIHKIEMWKFKGLITILIKIIEGHLDIVTIFGEYINYLNFMTMENIDFQNTLKWCK